MLDSTIDDTNASNPDDSSACFGMVRPQNLFNPNAINKLHSRFSDFRPPGVPDCRKGVQHAAGRALRTR